MTSKEIKVVDVDGKDAGSVSCGEVLAAAKIRPHLVHATVRWQRAKARSGTHSVLTRSNMKGGAKKPFKQKGTGRARAGSLISPLMVGGAVVHGPTPRKYDFRLPREEKLQALLTVVSAKVNQGAFCVVDSLEKSGAVKTKDFTALLGKLGLTDKKVLYVVPNAKDASKEAVSSAKAARNICGVELIGVAGLNVYSMLKAETILCSKSTWESIVKLISERSN